MCPLVSEDQLFTNVLDVPAYFNNQYLLGKYLLKQSNYPLTVESVCVLLLFAHVFNAMEGYPSF